MQGAKATAGKDAVVVVSSSPSSSEGDAAPSGGASRGALRFRLRFVMRPGKGEAEGEPEVEKEGGAGDDIDKAEEGKEEARVVEGGSANGTMVTPSSSSSSPSASSVVFPVRRVRILMTECEDCRPSHESVFLVNKAVELFLQTFVADAFKKGNKSVTYKNLSSTVCAKKKYQFLSDYVPEKIRAEDALKAREAPAS